MRRSCSTHSSPVAARRPPRLSAGRSVAAVTAVVVGSLLAPSAGNAAPAARPALDVSAAQLLGADSHVALARLEARAGRLSRQYRGQLVKLTEAETAAEAATARALSLRRQFSRAHRHIARLAAASYMDGGADPALALLFSGDPQRVLDGNATVEYLARQRSVREQELQRLLVAGARAGQTARHKVAEVRRLIANLVSQRRTVERLMAHYPPHAAGAGRGRPEVRPVRFHRLLPAREFRRASPGPGMRFHAEYRRRDAVRFRGEAGLRHRGLGAGERFPARDHVHHLPAANLGYPDGVVGLGSHGGPRQHHREPLRPRAHLRVLGQRPVSVMS